MHAVWIALGIVVLIVAFLDVFLTVLNYDESGFLATPVCELQWRGLRSVTRRLSRRWRPMALRQVTGLQVVLCITAWLGCVVLGFGFIYYGLMFGANFQYDGQGVGASMFYAMFLSAAQLSTVGTSQITPETDALRLLTIAETLTSPLLITLILTFLLGVYQAIRDLRTLSSNFSTAELGAGDPVASLSPYFPNGQPTGLDGHLQSIAGSFWAYADGLRMHHLAYYFQSGRDQFSLPYTLHMMGGTLAAVRWGLPKDHPASVQPELTRLMTQFEQFIDYLHDMLGWTSIAVPEVVSFDEFSAAHRGANQTSDLWLGRYFRLNRDMARLAKLEPSDNLQEAYERYRQWLPFAYRAEQATAAVSRDLDYQPLVRSGDSTRARNSTIDGELATGSLFAVRKLARPWRVFVNRWMVVPDPGLTRLMGAAGAMLAAAAAVITLYFLFGFIGMPPFPSAIFGGIVGMYAVTMPSDAAITDRKWTTLLMMFPAFIAAALGTAVVSSFILSATGLVIIAMVGVWIGRFGPRFAALGQMVFMAYYYALLLHPSFAHLPAFAIAAAVGTIWAYLFRFIFMAERPNRVLLGGLDAFRARLVLMLDSLIDAVSAARWDPDVRKRVSADLRQLHRSATFLQGQLSATDSAALNLHTQAGALRLRVFDTEIAAAHVKAAAQDVALTGAAVPIALRGQLAGMLDRAQEQLRRQDSKNTPGRSQLVLSAQHKKPEDDACPSNWPEKARRLHEAVREMLHAATALQDAQAATLTSPGTAGSEAATGAVSGAPLTAVSSDPQPSAEKISGSGTLAPTTRRAIQIAVATGLALLAGAAVTTDHQYWAALAAFLVLGGTSTVEETLVKGIERITGTVMGAIVGFGVAALTGADPHIVLPLLVVCIFAMMYLQPVSYSLMVFWMTMMLSLLYEFLGTLTKETLQVRVLETVIGAVIALGASVLLLPVRSSQKMNADIAALLRTLDTIIQACLKRLSGTDIPSLDNDALALDQQLRQLNARAEPLRRAPGALSLDGIERRLTAYAALIYYARHLIKVTETLSAGAAPLQAAEAAQLGTITRDNIAALVHVYNNELPGPVHRSEDLPLQSDTLESLSAGDPVGHKAVNYLVRINQTVLAIIEDFSHAAGRVNDVMPASLAQQ